MILVTDRFDIPDHYADADLLISILDPGFREFKFRGPRDKHCILRFADTTQPDNDERAKMDTEIRRALAWVRRSGATLDTRIVVHCHAGVSRSPALAWLILVMLGQEPEAAIADLRAARPKVWPNLAVLSLGAAYLGLDESFMLLARVTNTRILLERAENFRF